MRKTSWFAAGIGILVALIVFGARSQAFERWCQPYEFCVWDAADMPIPYTVDLASLAAYPIQPWMPATYEPFDVVETIQRAFQAWENVPEAYVRFRYAGPNVAFDMRNPRPLIRVYFVYGSGPVTFITTKASGALMYAEIRISTNGGPVTWSKYRFHKTMVHEIGHAIGLDHPREYPQVGGPVMGYGFFPDGEWARLDRDDIEGLHYLYPAPRGGGGSQLRVSGLPEVEVWPASGNVSAQGQDFAVAVTHSNGRDAIADVRVLLNGQDATPVAGWLFQLFGRANPYGYLLAVPKQALHAMGALRQAGIPCWIAEPINCSLFPVRTVGPQFIMTVIARDQAGHEARAERTYNLVP